MESKKAEIEASAQQKAGESKGAKQRRSYKRELEAALAENEMLREMLLRTAADFDNYRRRVQQEKSEIAETANVALLRKLLPLIDDLNRTADAVEAKKSEDPLLQSILLIRKNALKILQEAGVREMAAKGMPFDPEKHEALMTVEAKDLPPHTVVEEHQKGYEYKDRVLRHAKVIVSKEKE